MRPIDMAEDHEGMVFALDHGANLDMMLKKNSPQICLGGIG